MYHGRILGSFRPTATTDLRRFHIFMVRYFTANPKDTVMVRKVYLPRGRKPGAEQLASAVYVWRDETSLGDEVVWGIVCAHDPAHEKMIAEAEALAESAGL